MKQPMAIATTMPPASPMDLVSTLSGVTSFTDWLARDGCGNTNLHNYSNYV
jgi:hypothetical protein